MEKLVAYIEGHVDELVTDLIPALREADAAFRVGETGPLHQALYDAIWQFASFAYRRHARHLDKALGAFESLWPEGLYLSSLIRVFFGLEDLVAIRAQSLYSEADDFVDDLRALRSAAREALCAFADRVQSRGVVKHADDHTSQPLSAELNIEARLPRAGAAALAERVELAEPVGRTEQVRRLWTALRTVASQEVNQLVGIRGPDGYGKRTLVNVFLSRVERRLGRTPLVLRTRAPRLFDLPLWPIAALAREALGVTLGSDDITAKVRAAVTELTRQRNPRTPIDAETLGQSIPYLLRFIGEIGEEPEVRAGRAAGARTQRALVALFGGLALRARSTTGMPLFLVIEGVSEMDSPSFELLAHLFKRILSPAPLMVLLTYDARFVVPPSISELVGFSEVEVTPMDLNECEAVIDALLAPNQLDDQTRLRLNVGAQGSPLLLHEALRQLVEDGVVGYEQGRWMEVTHLPEGMIGDLAVVVARRRHRLNGAASEVLDLVVVTEDTAVGRVLEEVASRRAISREELCSALRRLEQTGLIRAQITDDSVVATARHPLIRDEIYRQMNPERRRAIHEDTAEVLLKLPGTRGYPALAAAHLAFAKWPTRALSALLAAIDRSLDHDDLAGALELANHAISLQRGLGPEDEPQRHLFGILSRRASVYARLGRLESRAQDLDQLDALSLTEDERQTVASHRGELALLTGRAGDAETAFLELLPKEEPGTPRARRKLSLALTCWQRGQVAEAKVFLDEALGESGTLPGSLRSRAFHLRALVDAGDGRLSEALQHAFLAWRVHRTSGDPVGEAYVIESISQIFWTQGRLLDAIRMLRRADEVLKEAHGAVARGRILVRLGESLLSIGELEEASRAFAEATKLVEPEENRVLHAALSVGRGRLMMNLGQLDEAVALLAQCLKNLGRRSIREPVYVDALVALATHFTLFSQGEKLVLGGLRYAGEAADRATESGYVAGLVQALVVQVRGLLLLNRVSEAESRFGELLAAQAAARAKEPRLARLAVHVELARHHLMKARGLTNEAREAASAAWQELTAQAECLKGSGYERGFLSHLAPHREVALAAGHQD